MWPFCLDLGQVCFCPCGEQWESSIRQGLCYLFAHLWATFDIDIDFFPNAEHWGPQEGRGHVALLPQFGPITTMFPC